jgi:hypothetical protein
MLELSRYAAGGTLNDKATVAPREKEMYRDEMHFLRKWPKAAVDYEIDWGVQLATAERLALCLVVFQSRRHGKARSETATGAGQPIFQCFASRRVFSVLAGFPSPIPSPQRCRIRAVTLSTFFAGTVAERGARNAL